MSSQDVQLRQNGKLRRRSKRLKLLFPVEVIAVEEGAEAFRESAQMLSVNANGGLLALKANVREGQRLRLVNRQTTEQQECRVVNIASANDGRVVDTLGRPSHRWRAWYDS